MKERHHGRKGRRNRPSISTHAPVKERPAETYANGRERTHFNSRSCEGATPAVSPSSRSPAHFNSRSCEGATHCAPSRGFAPPISTHAPVKERPWPWISQTPTTRNFNSRSCEGATRAWTPIGSSTSISTHAPVKERQAHLQGIAHGGLISTHAPVKERPSRPAKTRTAGPISTHAPVKERPREAIAQRQRHLFQLTLL